MKLLEYDARQFLDNNKLVDEIGGKKKNVKNGFTFGIHEYFGIDFWIDSSHKYSDKDFIKAVYKLNFEEYNHLVTALFEILARFLYGYYKQVEYRETAEKLPETERMKFFINKRDIIDPSNDEIINEINFIKDVLNY